MKNTDSTELNFFEKINLRFQEEIDFLEAY